MDPPSLSTFGSISAECEYWKLRSQQYFEELMEVKKDYDEFIEQSRHIEIEMDATLEQKEKQIEELIAKANIYEREKEVLMVRLNSQNTEISYMENQIEALTKKFEGMKMNLRILEQNNDDLEREHRITRDSKETIENSLFEQYEKNALLESEVEEKHELEVELQRLKDETRDLKQELNIRGIKLVPLVKSPVSCNCNSLDTIKTEPLKANLGQFIVTKQSERISRLDVKLARNVKVVNQFGNGGGDDPMGPIQTMDQLEGSSLTSNLQFLIRKTVSEMVSKLENLQRKLRAHRERRPLPKAY
ncbi:nuclear distribution protein nudE homolog [Drosophila serrata]|uniref:nuclear distribution protein nudE homolog n=1 Tax=Drosophila serrata TaxID=7274 RepID=UPI000A1CFE2C|nr:nuclear distribution protein nudE homolog [Drosophila serrata]